MQLSPLYFAIVCPKLRQCQWLRIHGSAPVMPTRCEKSHRLLVFDCAFAPGCCGAPVPGIFASYGEAGGSGNLYLLGYTTFRRPEQIIMEALGELQQVRAAVLLFPALVACSTLGVWVCDGVRKFATQRRHRGLSELPCQAWSIAFATE